MMHTDISEVSALQGKREIIRLPPPKTEGGMALIEALGPLRSCHCAPSKRQTWRRARPAKGHIDRVESAVAPIHANIGD